MTAQSSANGPGGVRLAELLAVLSLGADLGMGQPMEHAMRQCLIAWVGCHVDAMSRGSGSVTTSR